MTKETNESSFPTALMHELHTLWKLLDIALTKQDDILVSKNQALQIFYLV